MMKIKIKDLRPGDSSLITGYETGNNYYRQKLLSMGLIKGTKLKLIKIAPLGDPVQIELRGFKLSLRKSEAEILILERDDTQAENLEIIQDTYDYGFLSRMFGKHRRRHRGGNKCCSDCNDAAESGCGCGKRSTG